MASSNGREQTAGPSAGAGVVGVAPSVSRRGTFRIVDPIFHTLDAAPVTRDAVISTRDAVLCTHDDVGRTGDASSWTHDDVF
jgi:hypothetical protein